MIKPTRRKIVVLCVFAVLFLCYWTFIPFPSLGNSFNDVTAPAYLTEVWPPAGSKIGLGYYYVTSMWYMPAPRGVGVAISAGDVLHWGTSYDYEHEKPFEDRISLYVDGRIVSNLGAKRVVLKSGEMLDENFTPSELAATYEISWFPHLFFGKHIAKVVIVAPFGRSLEYEWYFTIR